MPNVKNELANDCDMENGRCAVNQWWSSGVDEICEFVARNTEKCPSSVPSGVHIMRVNLMRKYIISFSSGRTKLSVINRCRKSGFVR